MRTLLEPTALPIIREHNSLNGLRFVIAEFILVTAAALLISVSGALHGHALIAIAGAGMAVNALAVMGIAVSQLRAGEKSVGILKFHSSQLRAQIGRQHPNLSLHTALIVVFVLIPFLLVALLYVQRNQDAPSNRK